MVIGTTCAIICGFLIPTMSLAMQAVTNSFDPQNEKEELMNAMRLVTLYICLVGIGAWLFGYIYYSFWQHLAQNISFDLRSRYLHAILRQEITYFEKSNVEQLPSQIGENFAIVTESIGENYSNIIFSLACLVSGIAISFYRGADFAACCIAFLPVILVIIIIFGIYAKKAFIDLMIVTMRLGGVIEESLSSIRLIASFANERKEQDKFEKLSLEAAQVAQKSHIAISAIVALFKMAIFGYYAYSFYIATFYIQHQKENPSNNYEVYNTGQLLAVLVSFITGMVMVLGLAPNLQALTKAKVVG